MKKILDGAHFALFRALLLIVLLLAFVVVTVSAQQDRPHRVSEEQVRNLLQRLEERADAFRSVVDVVLEVSRLDGTQREDRLDLLVEEFERASDALEKRFDQHAATTADVERVLRAAERVNTPLTRALADPRRCTRTRHCAKEPILSGSSSKPVLKTLPISTTSNGSGVRTSTQNDRSPAWRALSLLGSV